MRIRVLVALLGLAAVVFTAPPARGAYERAPAGKSVTAGGDAMAAEEATRLGKGKAAPKAAGPSAQSLASDAPGGDSADAADDDQIRIITPQGFLYWDEQTNILYGRERAKIEYSGMTITADKVVVDSTLKEAQCEGNVIVVRGNQTINCDALNYNFNDGTGKAHNAHGKMGDLYFRPTKGRDASLEFLSKNESLLKDYEFTQSDFPEPEHAIRAKEVIVYFDDRVMMRSATMQVRGMPVFYLPFFSKSLKGGSPWFFRVGTGNRTGTFARVGYSFHHLRKVPSWSDDSQEEAKSRGHADVFMDILSKSGPGAGIDYRYMFDYGKHEGRIQAYASSDNRDLQGTDTSSDSKSGDGSAGPGRWQLWAQHRSEIKKDLYLQASVDEVSDPEMYYDILDRFTDIERGRLFERSAEGALTMNKERLLARVRVSVKHRIGRDRFTDFSDPNDNDNDFDVEPGVENKEDEGIPSDRWGMVGAKAPEVNIATNDIRLGRSNWYYRGQLNLFNSLDRGLNIVSSDDDAWVQGFDLYNSVENIHRFNERVTWLNRFGVGVGSAMRNASNQDQSDLVDGSRGFASTGDLLNPPVFPPGDPFEGEPIGFYDGLYFTDPNTFHIGQSPELASFDDVSGSFTYADIESRLNARFTNALQGFIRYTYRMTTENYLGDFYANLGDQSIRSDLYDFPLRTHWIEGNLTYSLLHPSISLYGQLGRNLIGASELWPNEALWYYTVGGNYVSDGRRVSLNSNLTFSDNQYYDPADPRAYDSTEMTWNTSGKYTDPSEMWWVGLGTQWRSTVKGANQLTQDDNTTLFNEGEDRMKLTPKFGVRVGPKWALLGDMTYDSRIGTFERMNFSLNRDLHDALLSVRLRLNQNVFSPQDSQDSNSKDNKDKGILGDMQLSFTIAPKLPGQQPSIGIPHRNTLDKQFRPTALDLEG